MITCKVFVYLVIELFKIICNLHKKLAMPNINLGKKKKQEVTVNEKIFKKMYQTKQWKELRAKKLKQDPYCVVCLLEGKKVIATGCGHKVRISANDKSNWHLVYDFDSLISLCKSHHLKHQIALRKKDNDSRLKK
jgi:5-methylcytosine-specific restriction enzyme A